MEGDVDINEVGNVFAGFNPHPRVEGDFINFHPVFIVVVSIHTLAWRVTLVDYIT